MLVSPARAADTFENADCLACHGDPSFERHIDEQAFHNSIHGQHLCTSCHSGITEIPHPETLPPVDCAQCHHVEARIYLQSDHGKAVAAGIGQAASCKSCHGNPHQLLNSRHPDSPVNRANVPETCAACHDNADIMKQFRLAQPQPYQSYLKSIHGKAHAAGNQAAAVCTDCHGSHDLHGTLNRESKIYRFNIPQTCGRCHENVLKTYTRSIHGKAIHDGLVDAPVCTDCHGEHLIRGPQEPDSPVSAGGIIKTCAHCHSSEKIISKYGLPTDALQTYLESYHGLAYQAGSTLAANCASCHGFHDILPPTDPLSSIHPNNLAKTCGKCHPGAGEQIAKAKIHSEPLQGDHVLIRFFRLFYLWLIGIVITLMLLHNGLDFLRKMMTDREAESDAEERMTLNERIQHMILALSFIGLAYTGMCHRFPRAVWAWPFKIIETGAELRRILHRGFAVIFVILCAYHFVWILLSRRGRHQLQHLSPRWQDAHDAASLMGYNAGWKPRPPELRRISYIEKIEYWALVWGTLVMTVTGFFLTFENFTLRYFQKWVIDLALTIHFYEALLAILAIVIWHFYWTIYDPHVYPMNWAWLTGFKKKPKHHKDPDTENPPP